MELKVEIEVAGAGSSDTTRMAAMYSTNTKREPLVFSSSFCFLPTTPMSGTAYIWKMSHTPEALPWCAVPEYVQFGVLASVIKGMPSEFVRLLTKTKSHSGTSSKRSWFSCFLCK